MKQPPSSTISKINTTAIITCAGNGTRFGSNKLLQNLHNKPVIIWTLESFINSSLIDEIIIAVRKDDLHIYQDLLQKYYISAKIVIGDKKRYLSALKGLEEAQGKYVVIHDGARPLVSTRLIDQVVKQVHEHEAVMTAHNPHTCIKVSKNGFVEQNLARQESWMGQTPHAYRKDIIKKAYQYGLDHDLDGMDDAELVSAVGFPIKIVQGEISNIKITQPEDLDIATILFTKFFSKELEK